MPLQVSGRTLAMTTVFVLLAGCASLEPPAEFPGGTLISFEPEGVPFCGRCDSTKFTAASDGRVWIEQGYWAGNSTNWTMKRRQITVSPEQFAAFQQKLEPYRPKGTLALNGSPPCKEFTNDLAGVHIGWRNGGEVSRLLYNFGCDPADHTAMYATIKSAPDALAINGLNVFGE